MVKKSSWAWRSDVYQSVCGLSLAVLRLQTAGTCGLSGGSYGVSAAAELRIRGRWRRTGLKHSREKKRQVTDDSIQKAGGRGI